MEIPDRDKVTWIYVLNLSKTIAYFVSWNQELAQKLL